MAKKDILARLREGGSGSGNFGHAGIPGHLGGSGEGEDSTDIGNKSSGIAVYHSTASEYASSIMKKGLLSSKSGKGMVRGVYASTEPGEAFAYGTQAAVKEFQKGMASGKYTEKDIPNLKVILIVADKGDFPQKIYGNISMSNKNIPPASFKRVEVFRYKDAEVFALKYKTAEATKQPFPKMPPPKPISVVTGNEQKYDDNEVYLSFAIKDTDMKESILARLRKIYEGGAGSGNFGHAGRAGEVGGSGSGSDTNPDHYDMSASGPERGGSQPFGKVVKYADLIDKVPKWPQLYKDTRFELGQIGIRSTRGEGGVTTTLANVKGSHDSVAKVLKDNDWKPILHDAGDTMKIKTTIFTKGDKKLQLVGDEQGSSINIGVDKKPADWETVAVGKRKGESIITRMRKIYEGGTGSGNFGHSGRAGEVGGSSGGGGEHTPDSAFGHDGSMTARDRFAAKLRTQDKAKGQKRLNIQAKRIGAQHAWAKSVGTAVRQRIAGRKYPGVSYDHLKAAQSSTRFSRAITKGINQGELGTNALIPGSGWKRGLRSENLLARLRKVYEGGSGSGNFGHSGRPGEQGGSGGSGDAAGDRSSGLTGIGTKASWRLAVGHGQRSGATAAKEWRKRLKVLSTTADRQAAAKATVATWPNRKYSKEDQQLAKAYRLRDLQRSYGRDVTRIDRHGDPVFGK